MAHNSLLPQTFRVQLGNETHPGLNDVLKYLRNLPSAAFNYFSDVFNLVNLLLVVTGTNAVSERLASTLRRLKCKTYL